MKVADPASATLASLNDPSQLASAIVIENGGKWGENGPAAIMRPNVGRSVVLQRRLKAVVG